jgi:tetratricopeptide (TPR) repeat protein
MDNNIIYITIIYLLIFRLSIVILGGISIVLGYYLFAKGVFPPTNTTSGSNEVNAQIGSANLTFKNAAPGSFFVVLGTVLVFSMVMTDSPNAQFKTQIEPNTNVKTSEIGLRGGNGECAEQCQQMATNMKSLATAMNLLAWTHNDQGKKKDASTFSKIATILTPQDANIRDTHAEMLFKNSKYDEAIEQIQKAIELENDPNTRSEYQKKLEKYQAR